MVPPGKRGLVLSNRYYDRQLKHLIARELDRIHREITESAYKTIELDPELKDRARRLPGQYKRITFELDKDECPLCKCGKRLEQLAPGDQNG